MHEELAVLTYNNLTELLLNIIRLRPAMYLGEARLSYLSIFLLGYQFGNSRQLDNYFGDNGFQQWFERKYYPMNGNSWFMTFLDEVDGDEKLALELYFDYLEKYHNNEV